MGGRDAPHLHLRSHAASGTMPLPWPLGHVTQRKPPAAHGPAAWRKKKARIKETRLGEKCRGDTHAERGGACPRPTKTKTTPARRFAPAAPGCHEPATPNAHGATPPSHRTSLALWRWILVRDVSFEGAAWVFFGAALNKHPSLCGVSWWSAGFAQEAARSVNLVW